MSGALTYVTIQKLAEKTYACTLNLVDFFDGGEQPNDQQDGDIMLKLNDSGQWEVLPTSKVNLEADDLQRLSQAIEQLRI